MLARSPLLAPVFIAVAAGAWGVYWLPQRALENAGLTGGWATLVQYLVPLILLAPVAVWRIRRGRRSGAGLPVFGLLLGGGIVCYANSFLLTDVVRALLLFYLIAVWATLIEAVVLRRRVSGLRVVTLLLAFGGIWVAFSEAGGWPIPRNAGDWLALAGGIAVAAGTAVISSSRSPGVFAPLFSFFLYGTPVAVICCALLADVLGPPPDAPSVIALLPWVVLMSVAFLIPSNCALTWGATQVPPGVFGILILSEIVVGLVSAALLAAEPFGWHEGLGGMMVLAAGLLEVIWPLTRPGRTAGSCSTRATIEGGPETR